MVQSSDRKHPSQHWEVHLTDKSVSAMHCPHARVLHVEARPEVPEWPVMAMGHRSAIYEGVGGLMHTRTHTRWLGDNHALNEAT